jgi:hypothetical protein
MEAAAVTMAMGAVRSISFAKRMERMLLITNAASIAGASTSVEVLVTLRTTLAGTAPEARESLDRRNGHRRPIHHDAGCGRARAHTA